VLGLVGKSENNQSRREVALMPEITIKVYEDITPKQFLKVIENLTKADCEICDINREVLGVECPVDVVLHILFDRECPRVIADWSKEFRCGNCGIYMSIIQIVTKEDVTFRRFKCPKCGAEKTLEE